MAEELSTLDHLIGVTGICQIPQESRTKHDRDILRLARKHIQEEREKSESGRTTRSSGAADEGQGQKESQEYHGEIRKDRDAVKEGREDST